jgi:predicted outer membrane protein
MQNKIYCQLILAFSITVLVSACNNKGSTYSAATDTTGIKIDTTGKHVEPDDQNTPDANRLVHIAQMHLNIIEAAKAGLNKPLPVNIKDALNKVITDNNQALVKLKKAAGNQNMGLPDSALATVKLNDQKLQNENGKAFERTFLNRLITMNRQAIDSCQKDELAAVNITIKEVCDSSSQLLQSDYSRLSALRDEFDNANRNK